jgi:fluoroquinolone transport system permease protein
MKNHNYHLIKSDLKNIGRDPMLLMCLVAPFIILLFVLLLFPIISTFTTRQFNFSLDGYFPILRLFFLPLTPMMLGMIYGFILLDERDGGIISYLAITPLGKSGYLKIRMMIPVVASFVMNVAFFTLTGFTHLISWVEVIILSIIVAFEAPMMLLFLAAFASNKVEGMAIAKGFGIIMMPIAIDFFFKGDWRWALSFSPLWWVERAVFSDISLRWPYLAGAAIVHILFIWVLYLKFEKKMQ